MAIILFGLTLVLVLVLLPVTCWIVGLKLLREDRLFEAGFLGWIAAMLFATIPIRNFLPGSPPPGSWVDVLVMLWVIVALTLALVIGLAASRHAPETQSLSGHDHWADAVTGPGEPGRLLGRPIRAGRLINWVRLQSVAAGTVIPPAESVRSGTCT